LEVKLGIDYLVLVTLVLRLGGEEEGHGSHALAAAGLAVGHDLGGDHYEGFSLLLGYRPALAACPLG
jgi:hypothetical protein